ncbi:unnamed protein product [marine sediment metagenome]|uniref:Uncharacterized protein n=1 Tax=marine sediment metagenome TaxID=412755 RepID=X0S0J8_9ZZZZ
MNPEIPKMIYVDPESRKRIVLKYPSLGDIISEDKIDETVFDVDYSLEYPFVDEEGILHLDANSFNFVIAAMMEFFRSYKVGVNLTQSLEGLIKLLSGEMYDADQRYH